MMTKHYSLKPLVIAIRTLIAGGVMFNIAPTNAGELPVPAANVTLSNTPVDIATQGQAAASISGQNMTIHQSSDKAILDWQKFNVGVENSVHFEQPSTSAVALNNIHQADASKIMGTISANGQVYLVNQNGFVFGKDSQVNVNSLVATTLGISNDVFQQGITKAFDTNGSAALQGNGEIYLKDNNGNPLKDAHGDPIKIQILIAKGANIKTSATSGRVIIAAPSIDNEGTIETPDGQAILAAAKDKVYLQEAGSDSATRGLVVEVGTGGEVDNVGKVLAERGNASLLGFAVNQKGSVSATTSVRLNGSVRLLAREGVQDPAGTGGKLLPKSTVRTEDLGDGLGTKATVHLSANSRTSVDLDSNKNDTAIDAQAQMLSQIEISGHDVVLDNNSVVEAKSGQVNVTAIDNPTDNTQKGDARIYLDAGSKVDVSGVKDVSLPMERNVVQVELRKNELRDSPLQRDGILYGKTVAVDVRVATLTKDNSGNLTSATVPIADVKGAVDRIARDIDERSTSGGKITLKSSGDVVTQAQSTLDFSGGSIQYQDGNITTTQLTSNGQVFPIEKADPNFHYDGITTNSYAALGYVEGKQGGSLSINSYEAVLDGTLKGETVAGIYQRTVAKQAAGSSLSLDLSNNNLLSKQAIDFTETINPIVMSAKDLLPRNANDASNPAALNLAANIFQKAGISNIDIKTNDAVSIAQNAVMNLPNNANLKIAATGFNVQGSIISPAGKMDFEPIKIDGNLLPSPITLGNSAIINVAGLWTNDSTDNRLNPLALDGGSVILHAEQGDLHLATGSHIDVSGGAWLSSNNKVTAGKAGTIDLAAANHDAGGQNANLILDGTLSGFGINQGGNLRLNSNEVVIGNASDVPKRNASTTQPLILNPDFFQQNGFASYDISSSVHGLKIADNAQLKLQQQNIQLNSDAALKSTGSHLTDIGTAIILPDELRNPTNLTLSFSELLTQNRAEALTLGKGASIQGDAQATINLNSDTSMFINGTINAPAGNINLTLNTPSGGDTGFFASQGIWLSSDSSLMAQGIFKPKFNSLNLTMGEVLAGGNISLLAKRGYIVTRTQSLIDVSGNAKKLEIPQGSTFVSQNIASSGGSISLKAGEGIIADGNFQAKGGDGAAGGSLSIELNRGLRNKPDVAISGGLFPDDENNALPRTIEITTTITPNLATTVHQGDELASENDSGRVLLNNTQLNNAGFASLAFKTDVIGASGDYAGSILFNGDVVLNAAKQIILDTPQLQTSHGNVQLNTAYAALGSSQSRLDTDLGDGTFSSTLAPAAISGQGKFSVTAKNIDLIGGLSFNGFNQVNLASDGDIRTQGIRVRTDSKDYLGEFKLNGDLTLTAAQVYPATLSNYKFSISGENSNVTINNSGSVATPVYSAAGSLSFNAANINQNGTIKVPFGTLNLNATNQLHLAAGSVTSVSGDGETVPFGQGSGGLNWLYPFDAQASVALVVATPPEKRLTLAGKEVALDKGANVNLNGGGDLYAYEFITGAGGTNDILNTSQKFAVLPNLGHALTPFDPLESANSNLKVGDNVYLSAGAGLAAGWYTLLPAHYALLPDAYLVTPQVNTQDWQPNQTLTDISGTTIVAGRYGVADAGIQDARWQGFAVQKGSIARCYSQYTDYFANDFFATVAAQGNSQLPQDAGSLAIAAQTKLSLSAELAAKPVGNGLGGAVDISADHLAIVGRRPEDVNADGDTVTLSVDDLNKLNAPSLLLGGVRSKSKDGQRITVNSQTLTIAGDAKLQGSEIVLAAKDTLKIASGAEVTSQGKTNAPSEKRLVTSNTPALDDAGNSVISSDGALLRVSSFGQTEIVRDGNVTGNAGVLIVEKGAKLQSDNSMLLDSTRDTIFAGDIAMNGGSLALNASRISLGNAPANTSGLVLSSPTFNLDELKLNSRRDLDIYGAVNLKTKELAIDAAAIRGVDNADKTAAITADNITLSNHGATPSSNSNATGTLNLTAKNIQLGSGQYAISGFNQVNFNASETLKGLGQVFATNTGNSRLNTAGALRVAANFTANAASFSGDNGSTTQIDASGYNVTLASPIQSKKQTNDLGSSWTITADSINSSGRFDLQSGILKLNALQGDITLNEGSAIDVSGKTVAFGSVNKISPAGTVQLSATKGNITLAENAKINQVGALDITALKGKFAWNGSISADSGALSVDVNNLGDFSTLNSQIANAGFTEKLNLEQHNGDINITATDQIKVREFDLAADEGKIVVNGTIDTSGAQAGSVLIYGHDGIRLDSSAKILATGGSVTLDTVHWDGTNSGLLDLSAKGALIDVSGGLVHLRTGRNDSAHTVNVSDINTNIKGADATQTTLEATRVYDNQNDIDSTTIGTWQTETANFMNAAPHLQNNSGANINLLPGIEIRSHGDLTLSSGWDFMSNHVNDSTGQSELNWRYGEAKLPGFLTLKAAKDVLINASITDAFANTNLPSTDPSNIFQDVLQSGLSWSYNIVAGGNVKLANAYFPVDDYGNSASFASQVMVRTGAGQINIKAGGDIQFVSDAENSSAAAAIYTAGTPAFYTKTQLLNGDISGIPAQKIGESETDYLNRLDPTQMNTLLRYGYVDENLLGLQYRVAEYPTHGGAINLNAGGNINGINTGQEISDWLVRSGVMDENSRPTAWGINLSGDKANSDKGIHNFNQNIGALGGGDININAGGDVQNLSVMLPTTGKPFGKLSTTAANQWIENSTVINGGGNLNINAGNDIIGGEYFVAKGTGTLNAGGNVANSTTNLGALLELGDANFNIQARQNINIASVLNPTVLKQNVLLPNKVGDSRFFTYGENSAVSLSATAGNVILQNDIAAIKTAKHRENDSETGFEYAVYPQTLNAAALSGDLRIDNSMTLFPSTQGKLVLLANNNIGVDDTAGQLINVNMSDANPDLLPNIEHPAQQLEGSLADNIINARERLDATTPNPILIHAPQPLHLNDTNKPIIHANLGNIAFPFNSDVTFFIPQASEFSAGKDIQNLSLSAQQLKTTDITNISAGRDITFDALINDNGVVQSNDKQIELGGVGELQIQAGRNISLGGSAGINTIGNTKNSVLPAEGASISLLGGTSETVDKTALGTLFNDLKQSAGTAATVPENERKAAYKKGYDAINALFSTSKNTGNLSLVFSQIKTLAGGDIYLAIPNGAVNVGLAGMVGGIQKGADKLGIVAQQSGDISAFTSGDFNVNQSRVFTMGGGDIAIWSSQGNIDAGKGAKSAISAPAPITSIDALGNIVTTFPPVVSGSGIQTINPQDNTKKQGNVYLAAPSGIVDAGEAGISGGKIVIAANAVVGASNISASGGSVGVPTTVTPPVMPSSASSAAASATKSATQMTEDNKNSNTSENNDGKDKKKSVMSSLSADVVGYGNCTVAEVREYKDGCGKM